VNFNAERDSLTPWINSLPEDWHCSRIGNVADVLFSNVDKHTIDDEEPVRLCNYIDVYKNGRITQKLEFMEASAEKREIQKFQVQRGDVLSTKDSETPDDIAISALVDDDLPGVLCGYHLALMRPRSKNLYGPYLAWVHSSKRFRAQYEARAVGVTRFGLSQYAFRAARLPLPPLPEQKRIAAYLDASCAAIDAAVAAKRRQIETLAMLLHATLTQILKRGLKKEVVMKPSGEAWLDDIPSHWWMKRIKDIAQLKSGEGISAEEISAADQFPVYGGNGLRGYTSSFTHDGYFPLIGRQGALCGNINYASGKFWATEHAVVVTPLRQCDVMWLGEILRIMNLNQYSNAAAQPGLSVDRIKYLRLPVPPVEEQVAIARHIREANEKLTNLNSNLDEQVKSLTAYRKSLIHECVTGQRRVTDEDVKRAEAQWPSARNLQN